MAGKRSTAVMDRRIKIHHMWMRLEMLVDVLEENLPIIEEALEDADRPTKSCLAQVRRALEKINDDD